MQRIEQATQKAILQFIRVQYPKALPFFIPNGSNVGARVGAIYKGMGLKAGVADICVLWKPGKCGFLEVKVPLGRLTTHQQSFARCCDDMGIPNACVRSVDDAAAALKLWGVK